MSTKLTTTKKITALLVPTFRNTTQNIATLTYLAAFSSETLHVIISDCSINTEKHIALKKIEANYPYVKIIYQTINISLYKDMVNMLRYAKDYEYIAIAPDDDYISLSYIETSIKQLQENSDAVCSYGNYIIYQTNGNAFRDSRQATEATPVARIANGFNPNYFNTMFFAVYRRTAMQPWVDFCKDHCLISSFFDFIHCTSLMAQGTILCHQEGHFLWTGENWDTPEQNANTRARYYKQIGLSADFAVFHDLHFGVEGINFFMGKHSPLKNQNDREECANIIWRKCFERFKNFVYADPIFFEKILNNENAPINALKSIMYDNSTDIKKIPYLFSIIIDHFSSNLAHTYREQLQIGPIL